ncbi:MAG: hypothetical protein ABI765_05475 [Gemmatimonadota bacterium]
MNRCDEMLDRMPDLALGRMPIPADFEAHLAGCQSCRLNWQVTRAGSLLGAPAAASIDPDRIAGQVVARLAVARQADRRWRGWAWGTVMAAAAALSLVVYTGHDSGTSTTLPPVTADRSVASFEVPVSGLDDLDATELQTVYEQLDGSLEGSATVATPHLEELSPDEMQQVLNSLEG